MITLNFDVRKQRIIQKNKEYLVNHSKNLLQLNFTFDELWDDLPKYIIFKYNEKNYLNILSFDAESNRYSINVPNIVLKGTMFRFTIYTVIMVQGSEKRITTQEVTIKLHDSGFTENISNIQEDDSNVDIFTTIFEILGRKFDEISVEEDKLICKSEGLIVRTLPLDSFLHDYYNKSDTEYLLNGKADKVHEHLTEDVTDFEDNVDVDLEKFIDNLTESIRIL